MPAPSVRILFIGNSFTTRNDLPGMLDELARHAGITIEHQVISAGGASLRRHFNAGASDDIRGGKWDYVILQEQSTLPIKNSARFHENVREYVQAIEDCGAELVLYMTWARKKEPENQKMLADAYYEIGTELGAVVVPAGRAWELMMASHDEPPLHAEDGSHPTVAGTFLAAYTFFATLFDDKLAESKAGITGLNDGEEVLLRKFAVAAHGGVENEVRSA